MDKVKCMICGNYYKTLGIHLNRSHKISVQDYLEMYPGSRTICDSTKSKLRECANKMNNTIESNPEVKEYTRKRLSEGQLKRYKDNPQECTKRSEWLKSAWGNPEYRDKFLDNINDSWTDERREELSKRNSDNWKTQEYREFMIDILRENGSSSNYDSGYVEDKYYYRSSYEKYFIEFLLDNNIEFLYENKKFPYKTLSGIDRMYIPDFYLPDYDYYIEIHPIRLVDDEFKNKISSVPNLYLLTEDELFGDNLLDIIHSLKDNQQPSI